MSSLRLLVSLPTSLCNRTRCPPPLSLVFLAGRSSLPRVRLHPQQTYISLCRLLRRQGRSLPKTEARVRRHKSGPHRCYTSQLRSSFRRCPRRHWSGPHCCYTFQLRSSFRRCPQRIIADYHTSTPLAASSLQVPGQTHPQLSQGSLSHVHLHMSPAPSGHAPHQHTPRAYPRCPWRASLLAVTLVPQLLVQRRCASDTLETHSPAHVCPPRRGPLLLPPTLPGPDCALGTDGISPELRCAPVSVARCCVVPVSR